VHVPPEQQLEPQHLCGYVSHSSLELLLHAQLMVQMLLLLPHDPPLQ